jgi:hypothetical protein
MRRCAFLVALCAALVLPGTALARECGIPDGHPLWVDYAGHDSPVPHKPGLTLAFSSGTEKPAAARAAGAATVFFDLNFNRRVGTPTVPNDPATMDDRADRLYDFAVSVTGCTTPWIALNELFAADVPTPWTRTTAQYFANTLALVRRLAERGAKPAVTIANPPYLEGEGLLWWRELAKSAVLIRQVFFTSPTPKGLHAMGPVRASRSMRSGMRGLVRRFTNAGIPANRVALELQFQSAPRTFGREGLQPSWKWFEIVKLQALAVRQVTRELGTHSIWSWGWATFSAAGVDPDKDEAVCVWLWARDQRLCDGPAAAGPRFDRSLTIGQLNLRPGVVCTTPAGPIRSAGVSSLARTTRDRDVATSLLLERLVLRQEVTLDAGAGRWAERAFVEEHFRGSVPAYVAALRRVQLTRSAAHELLLDEVRREQVRRRFGAAYPSAADVAEFHRTHGSLRARPVETAEPVRWLGHRSRGIAIETVAPLRALTAGGEARVATAEGPVVVRPLGRTAPLAAVPVVDARPAIAAALRHFSRARAYEQWLGEAKAKVVQAAICRRDRLPLSASFDLGDVLPFVNRRAG